MLDLNSLRREISRRLCNRHEERENLLNYGCVVERGDKCADKPIFALASHLGMLNGQIEALSDVLLLIQEEIEWSEDALNWIPKDDKPCEPTN